MKNCKLGSNKFIITKLANWPKLGKFHLVKS